MHLRIGGGIASISGWRRAPTAHSTRWHARARRRLRRRLRRPLLGKRGATIVSPQNSMLYTPLLPEAASGTLEPRHVVVPLRQMCPHADLVLGHATAVDLARERSRADTIAGPAAIGYERLVVALGAVNRVFPVPGPRRARSRVQGSRRRDRAAQPCAPAARGCVRRRVGGRARLRVRRRGLRRRRGARRAQRPGPCRAALLPGAARTSSSAGCSSTRPRRSWRTSRASSASMPAATREAWRRDPRRRDPHLV